MNTIRHIRVYAFLAVMILIGVSLLGLGKSGMGGLFILFGAGCLPICISLDIEAFHRMKLLRAAQRRQERLLALNAKLEQMVADYQMPESNKEG